MLTNRSQEKELLDIDPDFFGRDEYNDCLRKLFSINRIFGFFRSTVKLLRQYTKNVTILDMGCGGGLFLLHLSRYFPEMKMQGTDINPEAINAAQQTHQQWLTRYLAQNVSFQLQPSAELQPDENSVDIILLTLVCHHLSDHELITFLQQTYQNARQAVIINDLQRHSLAEKLYSLISPILFRNKLITHDGLISIRRGFTRSEWLLLLEKANIKNYRIKWRFPFRWFIVLNK